MIPRTTILLSLMLLQTPAARCQEAAADGPEERGLAIAREADLRDTGFGDSRARLTMILRNRHGQESSRELRWASLEVEGDGDKSRIVFEHPPDIEGTALLTFSHKRDADDQWLYLPSLKRVKRIASANKSGPFAGSEFAYEDLSSQEVEKYTWRHLRDEPCGELECFVVERRPLDPKSGYLRQSMWIDKEAYRTWKIEFYDRKDSLLKTFTASGYRLYLERYWRADEMTMIHHQTGKSTVLRWQDQALGTGLDQRDFDLNSLKRGG